MACLQMFFLQIWKLDQKHFGGKLYDGLKKQIEKKDKTSSPVAAERSQMRRVGLHHAEEDDFFFFSMFFEGVFSDYFFPIPESITQVKYFAKHSPAKRLRMLQEHKKAVQKILWVHQTYENSTNPQPVKLRYLAKWVVGWAAETEALVNFYSDSQCLFIVRPAEGSLPSWFKLYGLLSSEYTGYDLINTSPVFRECFKRLNVEGFQNEVKIWNSLPEVRKKVLDFVEFYGDMPKTLKSAYDHFGWNYLPKYHERLEELQEKQKSFKSASKVDESQITLREIKNDFVDVYSILLGRKKQE
eukprot:TRINITY_DN4934_c0_g1_i1.p1 TRINITY_DN4934_c0_g1~~TRINITY_DN4934_c0_g1_i1.p1  ORF type:complete len:299 (-),score=64.07 TRINITY_DN4934_c0_g1_i1:83-979(-)